MREFALARRLGGGYFGAWVYVLKLVSSLKGDGHDRAREAVQSIESIGAALCNDGPGASACNGYNGSRTRTDCDRKADAETGRRPGPGPVRKDCGNWQWVGGIDQARRVHRLRENYRQDAIPQGSPSSKTGRFHC